MPPESWMIAEFQGAEYRLDHRMAAGLHGVKHGPPPVNIPNVDADMDWQTSNLDHDAIGRLGIQQAHLRKVVSGMVLERFSDSPDMLGVTIPLMIIGQDQFEAPAGKRWSPNPSRKSTPDKVAAVVGEWNADVVPPLGFGLIHDSAG